MSMDEGLSDGDGEGILKMKIEKESDEHGGRPATKCGSLW